MSTPRWRGSSRKTSATPYELASIIGGALMLLDIIPAAALAGAALSCGQWKLVGEGFARMLLDAFLIAASGALVVWVKQRTVRRRRPLV